MNEALLRAIASDLNQAESAATRTSRMAALVSDTNVRVSVLALDQMTLDDTPYSFVSWLSAKDSSK